MTPVVEGDIVEYHGSKEKDHGKKFKVAVIQKWGRDIPDRLVLTSLPGEYDHERVLSNVHRESVTKVDA